MSPDAGLVALLHVSAVVSALGLALLGLDHLQPEPENFADILKNAAPFAKDTLLRLGLTGGVSISVFGSDKWRMTTIFPAAIVCILAETPIDLGWVGPIHVVYRQGHIPLLSFLKKRRHVPLVATMMLTSIFVFFGLAGVMIWQVSHFAEFMNGVHLRLLFGMEAIFAAWMLITAWAARRIREEHLHAVCRHLESVVNRRFAKMRNKAARALDRAEKKFKSLGL
jgi:hypothetical protein